MTGTRPEDARHPHGQGWALLGTVTGRWKEAADRRRRDYRPLRADAAPGGRPLPRDISRLRRRRRPRHGNLHLLPAADGGGLRLAPDRCGGDLALSRRRCAQARALARRRGEGNPSSGGERRRVAPGHDSSRRLAERPFRRRLDAGRLARWHPLSSSRASSSPRPAGILAGAKPAPRRRPRAAPRRSEPTPRLSCD